jgi:hypothetical protein
MPPGLPVPAAEGYTPHAMTAGKLEALLNDIPSARVEVVGDFCLDAY